MSMNGNIDGAVVRWDLENQCIPKRCTVQQVWNAIRDALRGEGIEKIQRVKVYTTPETPKDLLVQFANCGFDVAHCAPSAIGKAVQVDHHIITDLLQDVLELSQRKNKETAVVLIAGDGDFSRPVSILRNHSFPTCVVFNTWCEGINPMLLDAADPHVAVNFKQNMRRDADCGVAVLSSEREQTNDAPLKTDVDEPLNIFLKCIDECPPPASKAKIPEGFKINTQVGCMFHDKFATEVPDKKKRKALFKRIARRALQENRAEQMIIGSMNFLKKKSTFQYVSGSYIIS